MVHFRSNPPFFHFFTIFIFISFAHLTRSSSFVHTHQLSHVPEVGDDGVFGGFFGLNVRRSVAESVDNSTLILAESRTTRKDPADDFRRYTGGWNISNDHYWSSVAFTAVPLFVIAAVWFVGFGLCLSLICLCYCCCRKERYGYSRIAYALSLIFLIFFTIAAIVGCVVLYTGQGKFHSETTDTLNYVVNQADNTYDNLTKVSNYLSAAKRSGVDSIFLSADLQNKIDNIQSKINSTVKTLGDKTEQNSKDIKSVLDDVGLALILVAAGMLLLAFLGFLFSILGLQCLVHFFVVIGWILVAVTFILCGVFLLLHNVVADTCVAMDEWVQNPTAHTALDDILPCVDNATAQETLLRSKDVTYQLVNLVNGVIINISNVNYLPNLRPLYYNQSGPLMPILCNPLNSDFSDRKCASGEVEFNNAAQVWNAYVCQVSSSGICTTPGRVTPQIYNQMTAAANVSYGLYHYAPFLIDLEDCTFVRETFTYITHSYCHGLRRYSRWIYIGLVLVSSAVMFSLIFWVVYARERRHRSYTKKIRDRGFNENKAP